MPTLLESLMFWRRQPTPQAPHQAEDKLIALKKLKESFDFDPFDLLYDRYYSNGEWWFSAGSVPGIGGTANKVQGHDAYVFRTEQELRIQRDRARYIYATEPLAQAIVGHLRAFTVGCGFVYQVKEKKKFVNTLNTDFLDAMQQCIDDWIDKEDWCAREQELFNCQVVDGEWFLRIVKQRGEITVRRVEPEHITNPPGGTVHNGWYLGVNCDPHDAETVLGYYYHAYPHNDGQPLDVDEVIHFKDNVTRNVSRGVSSFFCLADDLDSTGKLIDNCRDGAAERAGYAFIRSHKNVTPSAVNSFAAAQATSSGTTTGGRSWRGKSSKGSKVVDAGENMEITTMPSGDTEGYVTAVGMMMRVLGNRWGMPEFMVSGDASNNNYASILVSGGPFVRQIEYTQAKLKRVYKKLMEQVLKNGAKAGLFPVEMLEQVEIDVQAPSPVIQDKLVEAETLDIECRNKVVSPQEWAAIKGRDPEKVQQDWDAFNDANMEAGMMMQGINPNDFNGKSSDKQKAQEQLSENTIDASGHAHLGKGTSAGGQFTGKGKQPHEMTSVEYDHWKASQRPETYGDLYATKDGKVGTMHGGELGNKRTKIHHADGTTSYEDKDTLKLIHKINRHENRHTIAADEWLKTTSAQVQALKSDNEELLLKGTITKRFKKELAAGNISQEIYDKAVQAGSVLGESDFHKVEVVEKQIEAIKNSPIAVPRNEEHYGIIKNAIKAGLKVPDEVVGEYPELKED